MMANNLQWNSVRADFSDANAAMGNAQKGLSQAGTIFGQLRQSILDEEQRAIDNAHRQKVFDENVRQFGLQHALNEDKLAETVLHNRNTEGLTARGQDLSHRAAMANVGVQREGLKLRQAQYNRAINNENALQRTMMEYDATMKAGDTIKANEAKILQLQESLNTANNDPAIVADINKQITALGEQNASLRQNIGAIPTSATELDSWFRQRAYANGYAGNLNTSPWTNEANNERMIATQAMKAQQEAKKIAANDRKESLKIANSAIDKVSFDSDTERQDFKRLFNSYAGQYKNIDPNTLYDLTTQFHLEKEMYVPFMDTDYQMKSGVDKSTFNRLLNRLNGVSKDQQPDVLAQWLAERNKDSKPALNTDNLYKNANLY